MDVGFRQLSGPHEWGWVQEHLPLKQVEDTTGIVAYDTETGERIACCVLDSWTVNSVQAHIFVLHSAALRHGFLEEIADYVFNHCERKQIIGLVPSDRTDALKLDLNMGFKQVAYLPDAVKDDIGMYILVLDIRDAHLWHPRVRAGLLRGQEDGRESRRAVSA